jgi:hypothetical protein
MWRLGWKRERLLRFLAIISQKKLIEHVNFDVTCGKTLVTKVSACNITRSLFDGNGDE